MSYNVHTVATAPESAKETLAGAQKAFGFLPNLLGVMAEAPSLVKAYVALIGLFEETSLTPSERQTVLLAASFENNCEYCIAAHSVIADMQKVPADVIAAIRENRPIADGKLEALRRFTQAVVMSRGWPSQSEITSFLSAGYEQRQVLEVVLGVGFKTLSNYTTHITHTPLDQAFAKAEWKKAA